MIDQAIKDINSSFVINHHHQRPAKEYHVLIIFQSRKRYL